MSVVRSSCLNAQQNLIYEVCTISGIKVAQTGDIIVSIPRSYSIVSNSGQTFKKEVFIPATLARVVPPTKGTDPPFANTLLDPFPSWDWQTVGEVDALQSVAGVCCVCGILVCLIALVFFQSPATFRLFVSRSL